MRLDIIREYVDEFRLNFPLNCGNLGVAAQYSLPLEIMRKYGLNRNKTVLDWGCGEGHISYLLAHQKHDVFAYSYTHDDLRIVKQKIKENFNQDWKVKVNHEGKDPITLPYPSNFFDSVISMGVLEHVRETGGNEKASLEEIYRILKPGGFFFCFHFPNKYSWIELISRKLNTLGFQKYAHQYRYSKQDIIRLVSKTSFEMMEMGLYNLLPRRILRKFHIMNTSCGLYIYEALEKVLSIPLRKCSQNHYFVLQKQSYNLEKQ